MNHLKHLFTALIILFLALTSAAAGDEDEKGVRLEMPPGYGNSKILYIGGRVYEVDREDQEAIKKIPFSKLKKAISAIIRFFPEGEGDGALTVEANGASKLVRTDEEGYFDLTLSARPGKPWRGSVRVKVITTGGKAFWGTVYVPDPDSKLGIISDLDDTIKITRVHRKREMIKEALMGGAATDEPVPAMAALYQQIVKNEKSPVFYVSASPDALSARIVRFLSLNRFPPGSLNLIRLESPEKFIKGFSKYIVKYKSEAIKKIFDAFPEKQFLLFGDSGQEDPRIYSQIASAFPNRIKAIYIREVKDGEASQKDYPNCIFFISVDDVKADLARRGVIR